MKINNNIQALNAYRNLNQNQFHTSKNLEKLSSGLRINKAADDAAGLAISEKMRSQIRGLKQAERNSLDGISLIQTAEGAMQEIHAMLQRMRELAVQAANDTNQEADREQIQKEINQLEEEINSISKNTEFNTKKLLDTDDNTLKFQIGANTDQTISITIPKMDMQTLLAEKSNEAGDNSDPANDNTTDPASGQGDEPGAADGEDGEGANAEASAFAILASEENNVDEEEINEDDGDAQENPAVDSNGTDGNDEGGSGSVNKIDVLEDPAGAITRIDIAISNVSNARSTLGAAQNRLEHTINNLQITHENLTAAESRIRDADMALEMTEFTRNNILNQSATAMLAQANQLPQGVLQLLQ
ncbi:flagellin [Evansella sp. LMS18]|uniref:flagellin N-terminal helical domain-containing protein n=1 Tax=Evansella sp. LMS18 TaxID=2924033 RepID=UPI0020D05E3D|nr:flagellin [Evansella sp. LMS18]UTR13017.1 flagellin [Evansella sp. LMS18]